MGIYFLPQEIALHNQSKDCWLSCMGGVYDVTKYIDKNPTSQITELILANAGKDVSHWFEKKTGSLKQWVDPKSGNFRYLVPFVAPKCHCTNKSSNGNQNIFNTRFKSKRTIRITR